MQHTACTLHVAFKYNSQGKRDRNAQKNKNCLEPQAVTSLASSRQQSLPWTRRVFGIFVAVWLSLVVQPCAMAFSGASVHDCPQCPPAHTHQHADLSMDLHAPVLSDNPCATNATDCDVLDDLNYDGRVAQLKLKDAPNDAPVAINSLDAQFPASQSFDFFGVHPTRSPPPSDSPPLNVLYCVYLI